MSNFILFYVMNEKNEADITPTLIEAGFIATIRPTAAGEATRVTTKDGQAFKVTGEFEDFRDALTTLGVKTKQAAQLPTAKPGAITQVEQYGVEVIVAKDDELNEEETPVDKDKNKSLTQKKK